MSNFEAVERAILTFVSKQLTADTKQHYHPFALFVSTAKRPLASVWLAISHSVDFTETNHNIVNNKITGK